MKEEDKVLGLQLVSLAVGGSAIALDSIALSGVFFASISLWMGIIEFPARVTSTK